jgi:hypothetical protein
MDINIFEKFTGKKIATVYAEIKCWMDEKEKEYRMFEAMKIYCNNHNLDIWLFYCELIIDENVIL